MREIRPSGSEGGVADNGHPYPYPDHDPTSRPVDRPNVVQTFDLRTPRLLGFVTFKVPSSESPARAPRPLQSNILNLSPCCFGWSWLCGGDRFKFGQK
jgi:hypothetical protein